eukprot:Em0663g2a
MAAPTGGNVVGGNANITVTGTQTNINQSTNRAAIDWQSFSVAPNESVNFTVPNGGATLNRVVGSQASLIQGTVRSNGSLYLVNPNGMVLDAGSQIFAQNFVATTSNIDPTQFMAGGRVNLEKSSNNAKISLKGTITAADRGVVGIFAPQVENQGTIIANLGSVLLAGSQASVIDFTGDGLINFELGATDGRTGENLLASNKGVINAAGRSCHPHGARRGIFVQCVGRKFWDDQRHESDCQRRDGNVKGEFGPTTKTSNPTAGRLKYRGIKHLNFRGTVLDLSHNGGKTGSLLLDPTDIEIVSTAPASGNQITVSNNNFTAMMSRLTPLRAAAPALVIIESPSAAILFGGGTGNLTLHSWTLAINANITSTRAGTLSDVVLNVEGPPSAAVTLTNDKTFHITAGDIIVDPDGDAINAIRVKTLNLTAAGNVSLQRIEQFSAGLPIGTITGTVGGDLTLINVKSNYSGVTLTGNGTLNYNYTDGNATNIRAVGRSAGKSGNQIFTASYGTITIGSAVDFGGDSVTLNSPGAISGTGKITAATLKGSAAGAVALNTSVTNLGDFTVTNTKNAANAYTSNYQLTVTNDKLLNISGGKIIADKLIGSATAAVNLLTNIDKLGAFTVTNGGNFTLSNDKLLTINGAVSLTNTAPAAAGNVSLTTIAGGITTSEVAGEIGSITATGLAVTSASAASLTSLNLTGAITGTVAGAVTLSGTFTSALGLRQTANGTPAVPANGADAAVPAVLITANTISGSAAGVVNLNTKASNLGAFTVSGGNNFTLVNDGALGINGAVALTNATVGGTAGNVSLTTSAGGITISTTAGSMGSITAHGLTVTSAAAASLTGLNLTGAISGTVAGAMTLGGTFGSISNLQQTANGNFTFISSSDVTSLLAPNRAAGMTGDLFYILTGTARFAFAAAVDAGANNVSLSSATALSIGQNITTTGSAEFGHDGQRGNKCCIGQEPECRQFSGNVFTGGAITGTAAGAVTLDGNFGGFGGLQQTASGSFSVIKAGNLSIDAIPNRTNAATGDVSYKVTGAGNILSIAGDVNFGANNVKFESVDAISIGNKITTTGNVTLTSGAGISGVGKISALSLTGSAAGTVDIKTNVTNLGGFAVSGGGNFTLVNDTALTVNGAVALTNAAVGGTAGECEFDDQCGRYHDLDRDGLAGGTVAGALTLTDVTANFGNLTQTGNDKFSLISSVNLTNLTAPNRAAGKAEMCLTSSGGTNSDINASITNLGNFTATGVEFKLTNDKALNITGVVTGTGGNLTNSVYLVVSNGGITTTQTGSINASFLRGSATDAVNIGGTISSIGDFTITNNKNLTLVSNVDMRIKGAINVGSGDVSITMSSPGTILRVNTDPLHGSSGSIVARNLSITSGGAVILSGLTLSSAISGTVAGAISLSGQYGSLSNLTQTANGAFAVQSTTDLTNFEMPKRAAGVTGDVSFVVTGTGRIVMGAPLSGATAWDFGANNVTFGSDTALEIGQNIKTTGTITLNSNAGISTTDYGTATAKKITAATITGRAAGAVNLATNVTNLGAFTVSGGGNFNLVNDGALVVNGRGHFIQCGGECGGGGIAISANGDVTSNATLGKSMGLVVSGNVIGTLAKVDIAQNGVVRGGVSATGISLGTVTVTPTATVVTGVSSSGVAANTVTSVVTPKTQVGNGAATTGTVTTTVTTTEAVAGGITIEQSGAVTASAGNATGIAGTTLTGTLAAVAVTQSGAVTGTGGSATGIGLSGAVTASHIVAGPVISAPVAVVSTSKSGAITTTKTTTTTTTTNYTNSVTGTVAINQSGDVNGTGTVGTAKAISVTSLTGGSGVAVTQKGDVTGNVDAYGIAASGAIGSSNGAVTLSNTSGKTITATTGKAYGINLAGTVSAGAKGFAQIRANNITDAAAASYASTAIIDQAKKDAATAFKTAATNAANAAIDGIALAPTAKITIGGKDYKLTNATEKTAAKAAYAAHYLTTDLTVLANIDLRKSAAVLKDKIVSATGVSAGATSSGGALTIVNSGDVSHGLEGSAQNYVVSATGISLTGSQISGKAQTITQSGAITGLTSAIGVNQSGALQAKSGDLTVQSKSAKEVKTETSVATLGTATGLKLAGSLTASAGQVSVSHDGKVTGYTSATGVSLNNVSSTGSAHITKSVNGAAATDTSVAVAGGITINESGAVTANSTLGSAKGIVTTGNVAATLGKVKIEQTSAVQGGASATGISLGTVTVTPTATVVTGVSSSGVAANAVTSVVTPKTQVGNAAATTGTVTTTVTTTEAVAGGITIEQSGAVTASAGNATGIAGTTLTGSLAPVAVTQSGAVTGTGGSATGIGLIGAVTASHVVAGSVISAPVVVVSTSKSGATVTTVTVTTAKATNYTNSVAGTVVIDQTGNVKGTVGTAKGISVASLTGGSGVAVTQKGDVTGNVDAYGIAASGAIGSSNGAVSVKTLLDDSVTPSVAKTITAKTGKAFGINLAGAVTTGATGLSGAANISVEQNSTVLAEKGSATGISTAGLNLTKDMAAANASKITVTNNGNVTATQSTANLSVSAVGVVTGAVVGGNRAGNEVAIKNTGVVTAKSLADTDNTAAIFADADMIAKAKAAAIVALSAPYAASATASVPTIDSIAIGPNAKIIIGGKEYKLTTAAQKAEAKKAWYLENDPTAVTYIAGKKSAAVQALKSVSATGVVASAVSAGGKLEIINNGAVTNNKDTSDGAVNAPKTGVVSSTGLSLGALSVNAGTISVQQIGAVTGVRSATGIVMTSASSTGIAHITKSVNGADATDTSVAVVGSITISESGDVASSSTLGKSQGIAKSTVQGGASATGISLGTVTLTPTATVMTGGVSSTGLGYKKVTSAVATKTQVGNAAATTGTVTTVTTTEAVAGGITIEQSGAVTANAGNATGIWGTTLSGSLAPVAVTQSGAVTGTGGSATGINLIGAVTASHVVGVTAGPATVTAPTTTSGTTKTTIATTVTTETRSVTGDVAINQSGDVNGKGTVGTAKGISVTSLTGGSGVTVTQKSDVTGNVDAYGIAASGAIGSSNGAVSVSTAIGKTITAKTGKAFGINLAGAVTTGAAGLSGAANISVEQNSTVAADKGSATGISTAGLDLTKDMAAANASTITVTNNGNVTANQSKANLSVSAVGVVTGTVVGGNRASNNVNITNAGVVKANNLATSDENLLAPKSADVDAALSGKSVTATGVSVVNTSAGGVLAITNSGTVTAGTNTTTRKYTLSATGINANGALASSGNQNINQSGIVGSSSTSANSAMDIKAVGSITTNVTGMTLSFTAINGINASGAVITAKKVAATSSGIAAVGATPAVPAGNVLLNNTGNVIASFGAISAGSFDIGSSIEFNLTGDLAKTSTASGSLMKVSNYGKDKNIGIISTNINANRAGGDQQLTFKFTGTGKFLTTGTPGKIVYTDAGAAATDLTVSTLNGRLTTPQATGVKVTNK